MSASSPDAGASDPQGPEGVLPTVDPSILRGRPIVFASTDRAVALSAVAQVFFPLVIGLEAGDVFWSDESDLWDFCPVVLSNDDPPDAGAQRLAAYQARITSAWGLETSDTRLVTLMAQIADLPNALTPAPIGEVPWAEDWAWDDTEAVRDPALLRQDDDHGDAGVPDATHSDGTDLPLPTDETRAWKPQA